MDQSEANQQSIRADIDVARQLAPADANVMAAQAQYLADVGQDLPGALALFDKAELAGLREAATLDGKGKSFVLTRMGRIDEAIAGLKHQIALDPGNGNLYHDWSANGRAALRPVEAMRVIDLEMAQERPGGLTFAGYRADTLFAYTGDIGPWRASVPNITGQTDDDFFLGIEAQHMGPEGQIAELERLLARVPRKAVRPGPFCGFPLFGVGQRPVAEYRGWVELLAGNKDGAARASREVFAYIASEPEARRKDWFLTLLSGTASVFAGDHAKGQAAASAALSLIPASRDALNRRYAAYLAARVYAWSGAADPSVALLEELATKVPGVGPATIIRDPLFTTPLSPNSCSWTNRWGRWTSSCANTCNSRSRRCTGA
jgi:tetratricopeptide (TPR) repeat protein